MVDLGFLLVTFFMLTTTFSKPQTMEINMPVKDPTEQSKGTDTKASQSVTVILGENNKVFWFKGLADTANFSTTDYSAKGLRSILVDMNKTTKDLVCIIKPTDKSNYRLCVAQNSTQNINYHSRWFSFIVCNVVSIDAASWLVFFFNTALSIKISCFDPRVNFLYFEV